MRTAVYPGSFNPMHIGHLAILLALKGSGRFDRVRLVVSPKNPLKDGISADSAQIRFQAAVAAVSRYPELEDVIVDDVELSMDAPYYTVRTLEALAAAHPDESFTLAIGADSLADFPLWKEWQTILTEYGVAVYPREGYDLPAVAAALMESCPGARIELIEAPLVDISSSRIRAGIENGEDMSGYMM
ncbi:MAG: nicotinate (nicotinamide) nucleotide adenylyltransferase [Bacteroidales bacterium]|nr:nicotinate (nicotinamide) nucleotide adenylyltransferase [Bacteroidales bacterium]